MNTCACSCESGSTGRGILSLVSRVFLAALFIIAGFGKIMGFSGTAAMIGGLGFPMPEVFTVITILIEFIGGIALLLGFHARVAAWALILFTVIVTPIFHSDFGNQIQMLMFLKNVAIIGGLLQITMYGAGSWALRMRCGIKMCPDCGKGDCNCCGHCECENCKTEEK